MSDFKAKMHQNRFRENDLTHPLPQIPGYATVTLVISQHLSVDATLTKQLAKILESIWCSYFQVTRHWVRVRVVKNKSSMDKINCL